VPRRYRCRLVARLRGVVPVGRDGVDEGLVVAILFAGGHECRLAVRFADELRGVDIGNPDLDWPQASLPQPFAVSSNAVPGR
jgi:hypothetical protein